MKKTIKIDEDIKKHIKQIESKIREHLRFEISGRDSFNWDEIAKEVGRMVSSKNGTVHLALLIGELDRRFKDLEEWIRVLVGQKDLFDIDQQSKVRFFVNLRKLISIFDEMFNLLEEEERLKKSIRKIFDEIYELLSHFPKEYPPTEEIELAIQKLEQAYERM